MSSTPIYKPKCSCIVCKKEVFARSIHSHYVAAHTEHGNQMRKECGRLGAEKRIKQSTVLQDNIAKYDLAPSFCQNCNTKLPYDKRHYKFCGSSCSAKHNNHKRAKKESCNQKPKKFCKLYYCKACGRIHKSNQSKLRCSCKLSTKVQLFHTLAKYFNFDLNVVGTPNVINEFNHCVDYITELYKSNSLISLSKLIEHPDPGNLGKIFKSLNIKIDTRGEASRKSVQQNRTVIPQSRCSTYKSGWFETKNHRRYFYRSSYELKFIEFLSLNEIIFDMEKPISYIDSTQNKKRTAMPDFLIGEVIIEIKSNYTFNKTNMIDKFKSYINKGYKPLLQLDFEYYVLKNNDFLLLEDFNNNSLLKCLKKLN